MLSVNAKANAIRIILKGFSKLPFGLAQTIGMGLGLLLYIFPNSLKKVARENIKKCFPELSYWQQQRLIALCLIHVGASAGEYGAWWFWPPHKLAHLVYSVEGEDYLQAARAQGKGVLILAPHLGAWEIAQGYMPSRYPCSIMYRPLRITALEDFVRSARERGGGDLLPITPGGMREAYTRLQRGEIVGIMPDQVPGKNSGVLVPFFGIPAWTMTLAIKLAQKTNATVLLGYAKRLPFGKGFAIHLLPVNPEIYNEDLSKAATAMNADIERAVRKIPEQFQWTYKRFKVK